MGVTGRDLFLIAPELALAALAAAVVLLDLAPAFRRSERLRQTAAIGGLIVPLAFGAALWSDVHANGAQIGFNGALVVDKFALYVKFVVIAVAGLTLLASGNYARRFRPYQAEFAGLLLFSASGLALLAAAADLITIYVALELATLPVVAMAAFAKTRAESLEAGVKYLLLSAASSAFLLYGFAFLYGASGTMQVVAPEGGVPTIAQALAQGGGAPFGGFAVMAAAVLAVAGFGFKLSIVPFHMWTPDVYEGAPTPVGAFLATASKAAAFAVVLRVFVEAFGGASADWSGLFAALAAVTMTLGNLVAIAQRNVKRLLGYSAIAHAGYLLIGVAAAGQGGARPADIIDQTAKLGASSALFYLAAYAAMTLAAFFAAMTLADRVGGERIDDLAGAGRRFPFPALVLAVALIGLTGIPPTAGFMGKLFLFNAAVNAGLVWLAVVGAVNSAVSAYYYVGVIRTMRLRPAPAANAPPPPTPHIAPAPADGAPPTESNDVAAPGTPLAVKTALGVTALIIVALGFWPGGLLDVARAAAESLLR